MFYTLLHHHDSLQAQPINHFLQKSSTFTAAVEQRPACIRKGKRERNARKSTAGADIQKAGASNQRCDGETVEQVAGNDFIGFDHCRQIVHPIPAQEEIHVRQALIDRLFRQRAIERRGTIRKSRHQCLPRTGHFKSRSRSQNVMFFEMH